MPPSPAKSFWQTLPKPILSLAPMAGVTDTAFRQLCKGFGADVIYTEFASADALVYESAKTFKMIKFDTSEQPVVCQIFGSKPEHFEKAAKALEEMGFAGVDINFGCPAYKVVKHRGGVSLMRHLSLCYELVQAACAGTSLPVSIKIRAGIRQDSGPKKISRDPFNPEGEQEWVPERQSPESFTKVKGFGAPPLKKGGAEVDSCAADQVTAADLVRKLLPLPFAAVMVHGRTFEHAFDGAPNTGVIAEVKRLLPDRIVLANGGVYSPELARQMLEETSADGLGIARGAWGRPWLFQQVKEFLTTGKYSQLAWPEQVAVMLRHAELALGAKGGHGLIELRKHLAWYVKALPGARALRAQLVRVGTLEELMEILLPTLKISRAPNAAKNLKG